MKKVLIFLTLCLGLVNAECIRDDSKKVVVCSETNFMWVDDKDKIVKKDFQEANAYCEQLEYADFSDWRLPNMNELLSIVDYEKWKMAINQNFKVDFSDESRFISSTTSNTYDGVGSKFYYIEFENGTTALFDKPGNPLNVRCVRDNH